MPTMVMTPEEFARLPWYTRHKIANAQIRAARRTRLIPREQYGVEWAAEVRAEATRLLDVLPPDPDAAAHRAALMW